MYLFMLGVCCSTPYAFCTNSCVILNSNINVSVCEIYLFVLFPFFFSLIRFVFKFSQHCNYANNDSSIRISIFEAMFFCCCSTIAPLAFEFMALHNTVLRALIVIVPQKQKTKIKSESVFLAIAFLVQILNVWRERYTFQITFVYML